MPSRFCSNLAIFYFLTLNQVFFKKEQILALGKGGEGSDMNLLLFKSPSVWVDNICTSPRNLLSLLKFFSKWSHHQWTSGARTSSPLFSLIGEGRSLQVGMAAFLSGSVRLHFLLKITRPIWIWNTKDAKCEGWISLLDLPYQIFEINCKPYWNVF